MDAELVKACVKLPFVVVGKILKAIFSNKILLIATIALVAFLVFRGQIFKDDVDQQGNPKPEYLRNLPQLSIAPRIVQTYSRIYPYATSRDDGDFLLLTDYFIYDGNAWMHDTKPLPLLKTQIVKIYTR